MCLRHSVRQTSQHGIKANLDKIKAIEQIEAPRRIKDVHRLTGSKSAEHALPVFKIMKKAGPMEWTPEAEAALQDLKKYLSSTPILVAPKPQELLLLYLAATNQVVSAVLVAQREVDEEAVATAGPADGKSETPPAGPGAGKARLPAESDAIRTEPAQSSGVVQKKMMMQHPVYFVSSLVQGARSRYSGVQKLLFSLLMALRKLRHYFQAHEIIVVTRLPLQRILHDPDAEGLWSGPWSYQALG